MRLTSLAPFVFATLVRAVDYRLLYEIPTGDTMEEFTTDFDNICITWPPAVAAGLTFGGYLVEPDDYSGHNADTEAKIYCVWENGPTRVPFTEDVATFLGATWLP
ncbi:hypothetical protein DFH06DRAFT_1168895 [Mycena polygramma]|nr:hypothetical protein DFH06DRAFT_1168895 [Mycena polygramma]